MVLVTWESWCRVDDAFELMAGEYRAVVESRGAALCRLSLDGDDLLWGHDPGGEIRGFQGQLLVPWPNRIGAGRYVFKDVEHQLEITEHDGDSALHGLVHARQWRPDSVASDHATLSCTLDGAPGYPFRLETTADYRLDARSGLTVTVTVHNVGSSAAPCGIGAHPYLWVDTTLDDASLRLPARLYQPVDEAMLPTGLPMPVAGTDHDFRETRKIGATVFDTPFTALRFGSDGRAWVRLIGATNAVALWTDRSCPWLQVYSADHLVGEGERGPLAVEPMTCPPNAFATGDGLRVLSPSESMHARFGIRQLPAVAVQ